MTKSPAAYKTIFTKWWLIDMIFYGVLMGGLSIVNVSPRGRGHGGSG